MIGTDSEHPRIRPMSAPAERSPEPSPAVHAAPLEQSPRVHVRVKGGAYRGLEGTISAEAAKRYYTGQNWRGDRKGMSVADVVPKRKVRISVKGFGSCLVVWKHVQILDKHMRPVKLIHSTKRKPAKKEKQKNKSKKTSGDESSRDVSSSTSESLQSSESESDSEEEISTAVEVVNRARARAEEIRKIKAELLQQFQRSEKILSQIHLRITDQEHPVFSAVQEGVMINNYLSHLAVDLNFSELEKMLSFILLVDLTGAGTHGDVEQNNECNDDRHAVGSAKNVRITLWSKDCAHLLRRMLYSCSRASRYEDTMVAMDHVHTWFLSTCKASEEYSILMQRLLHLHRNQKLSFDAISHLGRITEDAEIMLQDTVQNAETLEPVEKPDHKEKSDLESPDEAGNDSDVDEDVIAAKREARKRREAKARALDPILLWTKWAHKHTSELLPGQQEHLVVDVGEKERRKLSHEKQAHMLMRQSFAAAVVEMTAEKTDISPDFNECESDTGDKSGLNVVIFQSRTGDVEGVAAYTGEKSEPQKKFVSSTTNSEFQNDISHNDNLDNNNKSSTGNALEESEDDDNDNDDLGQKPTEATELFHFHVADIDAKASLFELRKRASTKAMPPVLNNRGKIPPEYMRQPLDFYYSYYGRKAPVLLSTDLDLKLAIFDVQSHTDTRRIAHIVHVLADIGFFLTSPIMNEGSLVKGLSMVHELFVSMSLSAAQALHDIIADSPLLGSLMNLLLNSPTRPRIGLHVLKLICVFTENTNDPDGEHGGSFGALLSRSCYGRTDKTPSLLENSIVYVTKLIRRARLTPTYGIYLEATENLTIALIANACRMNPTLHVLASSVGLELIVLLCSSNNRRIRDVALSIFCYVIQRHDGVFASRLLEGNSHLGTAKAEGKTGKQVIEMLLSILSQAKSDRIDAVALMSKGKSKKKKKKKYNSKLAKTDPSVSSNKRPSDSMQVLAVPNEQSSTPESPGLDLYNRSYSITKSVLLALSLLARRNSHLDLFKDGLISKHLITFTKDICTVEIAAADTVAYYSQIDAASREESALQANIRTKRRETFSIEWPRIFHACKSSGLAKKVEWESRCVEREHDERSERAVEAQLRGRIQSLYIELDNVKNGLASPISSSEGTTELKTMKTPQSVATVMESIATAELELKEAHKKHSKRHTDWKHEIDAWDKATPLYNLKTDDASAELWKDESHRRHVFQRYSMLALWASSYCYNHDFALAGLDGGFREGRDSGETFANQPTTVLNGSHFKVMITGQGWAGKRVFLR